MTKQEMSQLLNYVMGPNSVTEEITPGGNYASGMPRLSYHEYVWTPVNASGSEQSMVVTYQIDFYSHYPRHEKLIALKKAFNDRGITLQIFHEGTVSEDGKTIIHSYFSVDVIEDV